MVVITVTFFNAQKVYDEQLWQTSKWSSNRYLQDFNIQPAIDALSLKRGKPPTVNEISEKIMNVYKIQFGSFENFLGDSAAKAGLEGAIKLGIYTVAVLMATAALSGCVDSDAATTHYDNSDTSAPVHTDVPYNDAIKQKSDVVQKPDDSAQNLKSGEPKITKTPASIASDIVDGNEAYHQMLSEFDLEEMPVDLDDFPIHFSTAAKEIAYGFGYDDVYFGSCGADRNDLCFAATTNRSKFPVGIQLQSVDGKRGYKIQFHEEVPYINQDDVKSGWITTPEDLEGLKYYRTDGLIMLQIPGLAEKMRVRNVKWAFAGSMRWIDPKLFS